MRIFVKPNLKATRLKKGYSLSTFAEAVGLTKQMIAQIERRANGISPEKSQEVLKVLGVEFDDVFELVERRQ